MAITPGSVSVAIYTPALDKENPTTGDETVTGTGAALECFNLLLTLPSKKIPDWPVVGQQYGGGDTEVNGVIIKDPPVTQAEFNSLVPTIAQARYSALKALADEANVFAWVLTYIKTNAALNGNAVIANTLGGLQKSTNAGDPTDPPAATKNIPLSGGIQ